MKKKSKNFLNALSLVLLQNECCSKPKKADVGNTAEKVNEDKVSEETKSAEFDCCG